MVAYIAKYRITSHSIKGCRTKSSSIILTEIRFKFLIQYLKSYVQGYLMSKCPLHFAHNNTIKITFISKNNSTSGTNVSFNTSNDNIDEGHLENAYQTNATM